MFLFCSVLLCYWEGHLNHREGCSSVSTFGFLLFSLCQDLHNCVAKHSVLSPNSLGRVSLPSELLPLLFPSCQSFVQTLL